MIPTEKIAGNQIVAARGLLRITQSELAEAADVTADTVQKIESGRAPHTSTMERIRAALEARGIEFTNGDGIGVRLRNKPSATAPH